MTTLHEPRRPLFLSPVRVALYSALILFSLVLLGLTAERLHYTLTLSRSDPLNSGRSFYDRIVAELLVASILTFLYSLYAIHTIHKRRERGYATTLLSELVALLILWILWLVGAIIATKMWRNLSFCRSFFTCRLLTALVAFAWIGFGTLTILILLTFLLGRSNWRQPMHGRWGRDGRDVRAYNTTNPAGAPTVSTGQPMV